MPSAGWNSNTSQLSMRALSRVSGTGIAQAIGSNEYPDCFQPRRSTVPGSIGEHVACRGLAGSTATDGSHGEVLFESPRDYTDRTVVRPRLRRTKADWHRQAS